MSNVRRGRLACWLRLRAARLARLRCGAFGGEGGYRGNRWCFKTFGHEDSHAYEFGAQPDMALRRYAQGYGDTPDNEDSHE